MPRMKSRKMEEADLLPPLNTAHLYEYQCTLSPRWQVS